MATVDPRAHEWLARFPGVRAEVKAEADRRVTRVRAVAVAHNQTGAFLNSIKVVQAHVDALVVSTDPAALAINYGHTAPNGTFVPGIHAFEQGAS